MDTYGVMGISIAHTLWAGRMKDDSCSSTMLKTFWFMFTGTLISGPKLKYENVQTVIEPLLFKLTSLHTAGWMPHFAIGVVDTSHSRKKAKLSLSKDILYTSNQLLVTLSNVPIYARHTDFQAFQNSSHGNTARDAICSDFYDAYILTNSFLYHDIYQSISSGT